MHLEDADLARRAEAVLERAQRPVGTLALAFEREHAVDQVLEHPRAGDRALLRHVPDQDHGHAALLREPHQAARHLAHLSDRARAAGHRGVVEDLHRVDDADVGSLGVDRREHRVEVRLRDDRHLEGRRAEPLRAQLDLGGRLLPRHVEDVAAGRGEVAERGARERRLADAGRTADEDERTRHDAAAEHAIELADAGAEPLDPRRLDVAQRDRRERAAGAPAALVAASDARRRGAPLLDERVPLSAAGAAPMPLGALVPARGAGEDGGRSSHAARLSGGQDGFAPRGVRSCIRAPECANARPDPSCVPSGARGSIGGS